MGRTTLTRAHHPLQALRIQLDSLLEALQSLIDLPDHEVGVALVVPGREVLGSLPDRLGIGVDCLLVATEDALGVAHATMGFRALQFWTIELRILVHSYANTVRFV